MATLERECREELESSDFAVQILQKLESTEKIFESPTDGKWRHKVYDWFLCSRSANTDL
jgi:hypothetical protein